MHKNSASKSLDENDFLHENLEFSILIQNMFGLDSQKRKTLIESQGIKSLQKFRYEVNREKTNISMEDSIIID